MRTSRCIPRLPWFAPVCLALSFLAGCRDHPASAKGAAEPPSAAVALVQRGSIAHTLSVAGQFQPFQVVDIHAKVSGYLRHIYVDIGDRVHAGQTLATLEVPELAAQYRGTESEALRSQASISAAQGEVARARSLHAALDANYSRLQKAAQEQPGVIAAQELDNARSQADASAAQVDAASAALAGARQGAASATADRQRVGALEGYTTVSAPFNGVVTWRYANTGALIQAGTSSDTQSLPIVKLSQSDLLRLRVPVPEDAVRYIHQGDPMQIRVEALGESFTGKVVRFTRSLDPVTRTMETEVDVPNPKLTITPGMYANASLQLAHRDNILTVPIAAVQGTGETGTVDVLTANNEVESRQVSLGLRGSVLVEVTGGLQQGDRVVLNDPSRFHPGEQVTPRLQSEPAGDTMREANSVTDPNEGGA